MAAPADLQFPTFMAPPDLPDPNDNNPYGTWDGRGGPPCRMTEPVYSCSLCGENTTPDPTGLVRYWVIGSHLMPFVVVVFCLWTVFERLEILKKRIYSPFLLTIGFVYCAIASMPEVSSHIHVMNWNLCYDSAATGSILLFYIFISTGFSAITIALRKKGHPLFRKPSGCADTLYFLVDMLLIVLSLTISLVYFTFGKGPTIVAFIVVQSFSAIVGIFRINNNLGPSRKMFWLGAFSELSAVIIALPINAYMVKTGIQWLHGLLGLAFVINQFGIGFCILDVIDTDPSAGIELTGEKQALKSGGGSRAKYETLVQDEVL